MSIEIRPLAEADLAEADRVFRLAFGTEFGLPEPLAFRGDADMVRTRWRADPAGALGAFRGGELVGSCFAARWGRFGVFGPLTVRPDCWSHGIGSRLLEPAMALFDAWKLRHSALFTFPQSLKHVGLYQKFGFWPQHLTAVMSRPVEPRQPPPQSALFSELDARGRAACLAECATLTASLLEGLDLELELRSIYEQGLGDTVLLRHGGALEGFAACHAGKGSEAGSGTAFIKFGAVRRGQHACFDRLISACEAFAARRRCAQLVAGTNSARHASYRRMLERGFRSFLHGVAMQRPNDAGYNRPDCLVIDDWR